MALESASAPETLIQSNADDDLEDGEIPSDEDDEATVPVETKVEPPKPPSKSDSSKDKSSDSKSSKSSNKKSSNGSSSSNSKTVDRFNKYKSVSDDWAGDVEKAIKAVLGEKDKFKNQEKSQSKNSNNSRSRNKKRSRDDKEDDRSKDQKRKRVSDDENINDDDDEMLFVRGASPVRRDVRDSPLPSRRSHDRDSPENNSDRDSDGKGSRHRDHDKRSGSTGRGSSRRAKNDRGCNNNKNNKSRSQLRNEQRSGRRNQNNDNAQDADSICVYYMQGKCHRGDDCPFSHNALPPRKMELCKFYLMDCCAKRDKCLYMHHDFPCKFFHTGLKCIQGDNCKFSHEPLNEQVKNILLKHLETAPKEILGEFPRLSREGALMMINNTARNVAQGQDASTQKIPSLFDVTLPAPGNNLSNNDKDEESLNDMDPSNQKKSNSPKERKPAGKKTRWGSDDDRVPLEQIMLLQSVSQLGILPNVALSLAVQQQLQQRMLLQQCFANMDFYNDIQGNTLAESEVNKLKNKIGFDNEIKEKIQEQIKQNSGSQDVDLRQFLTNGPKSSSAGQDDSKESKANEESDHDEESDLVIAVPTDDDKSKEKSAEINESSFINKSSLKVENPNNNHDQEMLPNLPKKAQELFLRIQQQQRAANESIGNVDDKCDVEDASKNQIDWYSDDEDGGNDDDDDDDDDESGNLQIVIKDNLKDESEKSDLDTPVKENPESIGIPQPAVIVDKLGNLSKIDISAEVTKLLSSIKPQGSAKKSESPSQTKESKNLSDNSEKISVNKSENGSTSPKSSLNTTGSVSRDPRMSRDPRQRRNEETRTSSPSRSDSKKESQSLRLETSIYSSGITASDESMDTDLRASDQLSVSHKQDLDLRQRFPQDFGDTDLRVTGNFIDSQGSDTDLRQILSLPFKPAPSHVPCTEIEASIASHAPVTYKVYVVDIPRPNYCGLKLTKNDSIVKYDPRLRKIFRLSQSDIIDSPMSPPPVKPDTPKSPPPQVRMDPRRKTLEASMQSKTMGSAMMTLGMNSQQGQDISMGMAGQSSNMGMPMGQNSMMNNIGLMNPMMNNSVPQQNMPPIGIGGMNNMQLGPNNPQIVPNQMGFDPRYQAHRNGGPGLLGPAPVLGFNDPRDGPNYDGPAYPAGNFGNFGPNPMGDQPMMGYGPNGPNNMNFGNNAQGDWGNNQNSMRRGGRARRRNRNRTNVGSRNNRSPP
ncbi:hypothetical protein KQX54_003216 [Cotesia glomerata]|uniref:C3H1-type domain-containing protein n=1 Tax=Cotesia glomerata TaxID=32391 RepID=A0AAV7IF91_COTGL|nr:hypothetical protein KQX54_003216 [Cotesia glomerata]